MDTDLHVGRPQDSPGKESEMRTKPDFGEESYKGYGRLAGRVALVTGADSGIGRAVALAYAREGADVAIAYLNEHVDAQETKRVVEEAGRKAILIAADFTDPKQCARVVDETVKTFGRIDILVNNAAFQGSDRGRHAGAQVARRGNAPRRPCSARLGTARVRPLSARPPSLRASCATLRNRAISTCRSCSRSGRADHQMRWTG